MQLVLQLTRDCDFACTYCYQRHRPGRGMSAEVAVRAVRMLLDRPLAQVGGKGLFVKELEAAMLDGRADVAVHSMKDVPMELPEEFALATFGERERPEDAFVSNRFDDMRSLPAGSVVGTSSLRRECQLRSRYPNLEFRPLRGNVNTRLAKLDAGDYDAIILAVAGLKRLGFEARGIRRGYYTDNREDALIMWREPMPSERVS